MNEPTYDDVRRSKAIIDNIWKLAVQVKNCESCKRLKKEAETTEKKNKIEQEELKSKLLVAQQDCMFAQASLEEERKIWDKEKMAMQKELDVTKLDIARKKKRMRDAISVMTNGIVANTPLW